MKTFFAVFFAILAAALVIYLVIRAQALVSEFNRQAIRESQAAQIKTALLGFCRQYPLKGSRHPAETREVIDQQLDRYEKLTSDEAQPALVDKRFLLENQLAAAGCYDLGPGHLHQ
jgi:hypothetical protein